MLSTLEKTLLPVALEAVPVVDHCVLARKQRVHNQPVHFGKQLFCGFKAPGGLQPQPEVADVPFPAVAAVVVFALSRMADNGYNGVVRVTYGLALAILGIRVIDIRKKW